MPRAETARVSAITTCIPCTMNNPINPRMTGITDTNPISIKAFPNIINTNYYTSAKFLQFAECYLSDNKHDKSRPVWHNIQEPLLHICRWR